MLHTHCVRLKLENDRHFRFNFLLLSLHVFSFGVCTRDFFFLSFCYYIWLIIIACCNDWLPNRKEKVNMLQFACFSLLHFWRITDRDGFNDFFGDKCIFFFMYIMCCFCCSCCKLKQFLFSPTRSNREENKNKKCIWPKFHWLRDKPTKKCIYTKNHKWKLKK